MGTRLKELLDKLESEGTLSPDEHLEAHHLIQTTAPDTSGTCVVCAARNERRAPLFGIRECQVHVQEMLMYVPGECSTRV